MMRLTFGLIVVSSATLANAQDTGKLAHGLAEAVQNAEPAEMLPVVIVLKTQVSQAKLQADEAVYRVELQQTRKESHEQQKRKPWQEGPDQLHGRFVTVAGTETRTLSYGVDQAARRVDDHRRCHQR